MHGFGLALVLVVLVQGCVAAGSAVTPETPRADDALQQGCGTEQARPLVVDWSAADRADLHEVEQRGVAVVAYDCEQLRVLTDCHVPGDYAYLGVTPEQTVLSLKTGGEVRLNLPTTGIKLAAGLSQGTGLHLALATVGKAVAQTTGRLRMVGSCSGATHLVRGIYRGAFAMETGARGHTRSSAEILGIGANAHAGERRALQVNAGDAAICMAASSEQSHPPVGCDIPLKLELRMLAGQPETIALVDDFVSCPSGYVERSGICERRSTSAFACAPTEAQECETQCAAGNAVSCARLAHLLLNGEGKVEIDRRRAWELYGVACRADVPHGCAGRGAILREGMPGLPADPPQAFALQERACRAGEVRACNALAVFYDEGEVVGEDPVHAFKLYARACAGGHALGCSNVGTLYRDGRGIAVDRLRAARHFQRACLGRSATGCDNLLALAVAHQAPPDTVQTLRAVYLTECKRGVSSACAGLGRLQAQDIEPQGSGTTTQPQDASQQTL